MPFSLRQIRYFIAAAETGQVTQAATELNVSQSAVTTAIKNLEEILNATLFFRHSHGISLTFEGKEFLYRAKNIITAVEYAPHFPRRGNEKLTGTIRLAVTYTVAGYYLPSLLARFNSDYPGIRIALEESSRVEIEDGLSSGKYDMSVMLTSNLADRDALAYKILSRSNRRLWVCADHDLLERQSVSLRELCDFPYIMLTVDEASRTTRKYWAGAGCCPEVIFRTSSVEAVRSLVAHGIGITVLSDLVYRPWSLEGKRINVIPVSDPVPTMDLGLVWEKNRNFSPAEKAFRDFMSFSVNSAKNDTGASKAGSG